MAATYDHRLMPIRRSDFDGTPGFSASYGAPYDDAEANATWRELQTRIPRIREMQSRSPVVGGGVGWRTEPLNQARVEFVAPGDDPTDEEVEAAEWCQSVFADAPLAVNIHDLKRWLTTALPNGFAVVEWNAVADPQGRLTPYQAEFRSQYSISQAADPFIFDDKGRLVGIEQDPSALVGKREPKRMDVANCMVATYRGTGDPSGNSFLRCLERPEFLSHRASVHLGLRIQRVSQPVAVFEGVGQFDKKKQDRITAQMRRLWSADGPSFSLFDGDKFRFEGAPDGEGSVITAGIQHFDWEIGVGLGVPGLTLGQNSGSYSLGVAFLDVYKSNLDSDAAFIASVLTEFAGRFVRKNWGNIRCPQARLVDVFERSADKLIASLGGVAAIVPEAAEALSRYISDEFGVERNAPEVASEDAESADGVTATVATGDVQRTALNGAQVTALADVVGRVTAGMLTEEQAITIIVSSFPVSRKAAEAMVGMGKAPARGPDPTPPTKPDSGAPDDQADPNNQPESSEADDPDDAPMEATAEFSAKWRTPRPEERCVNFASVDNALTDASTRIRTATSVPRDKLVDSLMEQARRVIESGDIRGVNRIKAPRPVIIEMRKAVRGVLLDVRAEGSQAVSRELRRQQRQGAEFSAALLEFVDPEKPPADPENAKALIDSQAEQSVDEMVNPVVAAVSASTREALATGETAKGTSDIRIALDEMERVAVERAENAAQRVGRYSTATAYSLGRQQAATKAEEDTGEEFTAHYSALLDVNACQFCIAAEQYSINNGGLLVGSAEYYAMAPPLGPNRVTQQGCSGGGNCRCIYVYEPGAPRVGRIAGDLS